MAIGPWFLCYTPNHLPFSGADFLPYFYIIENHFTGRNFYLKSATASINSIPQILIRSSPTASLIISSASANEVAKTAKNDVITSLKAILKKKLKAEPSSLKESVIPNMYEAIYGTEVVYVSADGKYFISGAFICSAGF